MRIISGTVGMESERSYSSSEKTSRYSAYGIGGEGVSGFMGNSPGFGNVLQEKTGEKGDKQQKQKGKLCDLSDVMSGVASSGENSFPWNDHLSADGYPLTDKASGKGMLEAWNTGTGEGVPGAWNTGTGKGMPGMWNTGTGKGVPGMWSAASGADMISSMVSRTDILAVRSAAESSDGLVVGDVAATGSLMNDEFSERISFIRQQCIKFILSILLGWDQEEVSKVTGAGRSSQGGFGFTIMKAEGMRYEYTEEQETDFSASGQVLTEDGRNISFEIGVSMSSSFRQYYEEHGVREVSFTDPLVINLNGNGACDISDQKFYFDLDCDGEKEEISEFGADTGLLALDLNGDGLINDGSELFGTASGNGFRDLAKYDEDHNGWIDENDSVFEKLRIWAAAGGGEQELYTLKEQDVGAIYLGSADTEFNLRDGNMDVAAKVRSTGLFLYESSGLAGTVQQVDLAG